MTASELADRHPVLFHMAEAGAWAQIAAHGLLPATGLLELFEVGGARRQALEREPRRESVVLEHPLHGRATLRDQLPLCGSAFRRSLTDVTPREWLRLLNGHVFFWPDEARLARLLAARLFRDRAHDVIVVDTGALLERHLDRVRVSRINSGYAGRKPARRGRATFEVLSETVAPARRPVAEVVVDGGVPDIAEVALRVERRSSGTSETIWRRPS